MKVGTRGAPHPWTQAMGEAERRALRAYIDSLCIALGECLIYRKSMYFRCFDPAINAARSMTVSRAYWLAAGGDLSAQRIRPVCGQPQCLAHIKLVPSEGRKRRVSSSVDVASEQEDELMEARLIHEVRQRCHAQVKQAQQCMREQRRTMGIWGGLVR